MQTKLKNAVIRQLGDRNALKDIYNHGASAGFPGFTYYKETVAFFRKNKKAIVELAEEMAESLGEDVLSMIKGFRCLDNSYSASEVGKIIYGRYNENLFQIANALSWFALEEVAREVCEQEEE
jgi:hypothetical protein